MKKFNYVARIYGSIEATDEIDASTKLKKDGIHDVISISADGESSSKVRFKYEAMDNKGEVITGEMQDDDGEDGVRKFFKDKGYYVTLVEKVEEKVKPIVKKQPYIFSDFFKSILISFGVGILALIVGPLFIEDTDHKLIAQEKVRNFAVLLFTITFFVLSIKNTRYNSKKFKTHWWE